MQVGHHQSVRWPDAARPGPHNVTGPALERAGASGVDVFRRRSQLEDRHPADAGDPRSARRAIQHPVDMEWEEAESGRAGPWTTPATYSRRCSSAVRGTRSIYHNNAIQSWKVAAERRGEQCPCPALSAPLALCLFAGATMAAETAGAAWPASAAPPRRRKSAWDIDVRPTSAVCRPVGHGCARRDIWEARCASCHGVFGESNEVFTPIVGGTTKKDIETGRVAALAKGSEAQRTTMMKVSTLSNAVGLHPRAMPWNNLRTLSVDDTYAVTAYILNLAEVLPADFTLSDRNIRDAHAAQPQRQDRATWTGCPPASRTKNTACMRDCAPAVKVSSLLPDHARGSHGNIEEQTRNLGGLRGQQRPQPANRPRRAVNSPR